MKRITYISSSFERLDVILIKDNYSDIKHAHLNPNDAINIDLPDDFDEVHIVSNCRKIKDIKFLESDINA